MQSGGNYLGQPVQEARIGQAAGNRPEHTQQYNTRLFTPPPPGKQDIVAPLNAFGLFATTPPLTDPQTTMQRGDEVNAIQRMLNDTQTSTLLLIGSPGSGKSTLAGIWYQRMLLAKQQGLPAPRYLLWLTIGSYTTLPDIINAILKGVEVEEPGLFLLKPEQQISTLLRALRRPQENTFVILDQFESLLYPEANQNVAGRGSLPAFLQMLQTDLGASRVMLTSYHSPYNEQKQQESHVRSYLVSRISLPEGIALLQQRGLQGSQEDFSLAWQRCTGHVFTLVLLSILVQTSTIPLYTLLNAQAYQSLWGGDVAVNLIGGIYRHLSPLHHAILHTLSLFTAPAPLEGLLMIVSAPKNSPAGSAFAPALCEREIQRLVQIGLIQPVVNMAGEICYTLHTTLRQYVLEHFLEGNPVQNQSFSTGGTPVVSPPKDADARQIALATGHTQVAGYYRQVLQERCLPREQRTGPQDVEPVIEAIRHLCQGWRWQRACDLLFEEGLHESMVQWGTWNALLGLYTGMLPPLGVLLRRDEALVASHVATLYGRLGEPQQSKTYFEQALTIQRQIPDPQGEAVTLTNQGELLRARGDLEQARQSFERAISLLDTKSDPQLRCILLHNLGLLFQHQKDYEQALQCYTEALQLATALGKQYQLGVILTNLGMLLYEQREHQEALALLLAALRVREMVQDPSAPLLERFLVAIEQKIGTEAYTEACKEALAIQPQVFARFAPQEGGEM